MVPSAVDTRCHILRWRVYVIACLTYIAAATCARCAVSCASRAQRHNKRTTLVEHWQWRHMDTGAIPVSSTVNFALMRRRRFRPKKTPKVEKPAYRVNDKIDVPTVFVIDTEGKARGEMATADAIALAQSEGLDLVEVSPKAQPPVCRIADFGKIQYQKSKEARARSANKKKTTTKGVRIGVRTGANDLAFKQKQVDNFLLKGNKARIEIILRGRERAHKDLAREALSEFVAGITTPHKVEEEIKSSPRGFQITIAPE